MIRKLIDIFRTGNDRPIISDQKLIRKIYESKRWSVFVSIVLGYGFFYTTRLSLSVAKKQMIDADVVDVQQLGIIGACPFICVCIWKIHKWFSCRPS